MNDKIEMKEPVVPSTSFSQKINVLIEYCSRSNLYSIETAENAISRQRIEKIHKALEIVALETAELEKLANNKAGAENLAHTESISQFMEAFNTTLTVAACPTCAPPKTLKCV